VANIAATIFFANDVIDVFSFDDIFSTARVSERLTDETAAQPRARFR
jgi:hypothetical protein